MNPQAGAGQNPYLSAIQGATKSPMGGGNPMMNRAVQQPPQMATPQPGGMQGPGALAQAIQQGANAGPTGTQGAGAAKANMPSNTPGSNPGSTDALIKALGAMNQVITATDDAQEIQDARKIILILQQMIQRDQQKQTSTESAFGQAKQGAAQYPPQILQAPGGLGTPPTR